LACSGARCGVPKYASLGPTLAALHLDRFEQPGRKRVFQPPAKGFSRRGLRSGVLLRAKSAPVRCPTRRQGVWSSAGPGVGSETGASGRGTPGGASLQSIGGPPPPGPFSARRSRFSFCRAWRVTSFRRFSLLCCRDFPGTCPPGGVTPPPRPIVMLPVGGLDRRVPGQCIARITRTPPKPRRCSDERSLTHGSVTTGRPWCCPCTRYPARASRDRPHRRLPAAARASPTARTM
jgi:hypothetical protein